MDDGLADQYSIKRIPMDIRKSQEMKNGVFIDAESFYSMLLAQLRNIGERILGKRKPSKAKFLNHFPGRCRTKINFIFCVQKYVFGLSGEFS